MGKVRKLTMSQAIIEAVTEEMEADESVILVGNQVSVDGSFGVNRGIGARFGPSRVIDTAIAEEAATGFAIGAAFMGARPIVDYMMADFMTVALDPIAVHAAKFQYLSAGTITQMPLVLRAPLGSSIEAGPHHANMVYAAFANYPGLKICAPTTPYDAKGLYKAAIRDNNPVIIFEAIQDYTRKGEVPEEPYLVPLGQANVLREGRDITIAAFAVGVDKAVRAAKLLEKEGIAAEVIDMRSLIPLDEETILKSVKKTKRLLLVDEGCESFGITGEIAFRMTQEAWDVLAMPVARVTMKDVSIPSGPMERAVWVTPEQVAKKVKDMLNVKEG